MALENKIIHIDGERWQYKIKRVRRIKYLRLAVRADAAIVITAPRIYPLFLIQNYIKQKWEWIKEAVVRQKSRQGILSLRHSPEQVEQYKKITLDLVKERLAFFNQQYGWQYGRISVRNQNSRWASCSSKKNLNFNYRLCLLPADLADYIIVHELCHLTEMNHSARFWALLARAVPDYKSKIKIIKDIG